MEKILIINPQYPLPEDNGSRMRTMNFVRFFEKYGVVDLVYFVPKQQEFEGSPFRKEMFINLIIKEEKNGSSFPDFRDRMQRVLERRPRTVANFSKEAREQLLNLIIKENYDVILCRYILYTFPLFRLPEKIRKRIIVDFDDVVSTSLHEALCKFSNSRMGRLKRGLDKNFLLQYEKKCLNFGAASFCSNEDLREIPSDKRKNSYVVPNTYPSTSLFNENLGDGYKKRSKFLFVGALGYGPNSEGLQWFINSIFPYVRERFIDSKLIVVGKKPSEKIIGMCHDNPYIELNTNAPDLKPFYRECGIAIVPLLSGGGTRIKILEAGLVGRPVLSTPLGAYGLEAQNGKDLLLFTDKDSFLSQLNSLNDKATYDSLVGNLRKVVMEKYSVNSFNSAMDHLISRLI